MFEHYKTKKNRPLEKWVYVPPKWWWRKHRGGYLYFRAQFVQYAMHRTMRKTFDWMGKDYKHKVAGCQIPHSISEVWNTPSLLTNDLDCWFRELHIAFKDKHDALQFKLVYSEHLESPDTTIDIK
jgi:hypothetical protein